MQFQKYDIVEVDLNPRKGHAQSGVRPAVILSSNLFNAHAKTCIVVPLTSQTKKIFPSDCIISPTSENGLRKISRFLGSQITTLDGNFLIRKIGVLEPKYYNEIEECISLALDLTRDF